MSKLNNTLERVSESNNDYRKFLRKLSNQIDERTTALVGDVVTLSNYTTDFSNTISASKEKAVTPIYDAASSYVIKDLRSVETVNEQFIEKINDKIENTKITSNEEKEEFINSLDSLLNNKYLEIVSIKRVPFLVDGKNEEVEEHINDFINYLKSSGSYNEADLVNLIDIYKKDIYTYISNAISDISLLYQNNFINEVSAELKTAVQYETKEDSENEGPAISSSVLPKPVLEAADNNAVEIPNEVNVLPAAENIAQEKVAEPVLEPIKVEEPTILAPNDDILNMLAPNTPEVPEEKPEPKKTYDVEEILRIAKSPVATYDESNVVPEAKESTNLSNQETNDIVSVNANEQKFIKPISLTETENSMELEFNEQELVDEMINRFKKRLELIDKRQEDYDNEKRLVENDEAFVNDLIASANEKLKELDALEEELNRKENELKDKENELKTKINNVLPFANAVLENQKES